MAWETRLRAWLTEPAYGLAALRIAVVGILLLSPELRHAPELARSPELLIASPEGLGWLAGVRFAPGIRWRDLFGRSARRRIESQPTTNASL